MSIQAKGESIAPAVSYATNGGVFVWGALTLNQLLAISAFVLALATFAVNVYFQRRRDRRESEFHDKRMEVKDTNERLAQRLPDNSVPRE